MKIIAVVLLFAGLIFSAHADKLVVADFEDCGTWRGGSRNDSGKWFSGFSSFGGSTNEVYQGNFTGRFVYFFDNPPYTMSVTRLKIQEKTITQLDAVEFAANPKGFDCTLTFGLRDATGWYFSVSTNLTGDGWSTYSLPVNASAVPGYEGVTDPVHLDRIILTGGSAGEGSVYVDDIALSGSADSVDRLSVFPVYTGVAHDPAAPVVLTYCLRNATENSLTGTLSLDGEDFYGETETSAQAAFSLAAYAETNLSLSLGTLPVGHYTAQVTASAGGLNGAYTDQFGVYVPNNGRTNSLPMWFGIQEHELWISPGEMNLHEEWLHGLGADIARLWVTGSRLESVESTDNTLPSAAGFSPAFDRYDRLGMDVAVLYSDTPKYLMLTGVINPQWLAPTDMAKFETHLYRTGLFLTNWPNVKYFEFWNEPAGGFFTGTMPEFADMTIAAHDGLRAATTNILITCGGLTPTRGADTPGFDEMVLTQLYPYYDISAYHNHGPLSATEHPFDLVDCHNKMEYWIEQSGRDPSDVRFCNTENGVRNFYTADGRDTQAEELVKQMTFSRAAGLEFCINFTLQDVGDMEPTDDSWGIVTSDNRVNPGFVAYNELIRRLADTQFEDRAYLHPSLVTYQFRHTGNSNRVYVCWPEEEGQTLHVPLSFDGSLELVDLFGRSQSIHCSSGETVTLPAQSHPFYLVSSPTLPVGADYETGAADDFEDRAVFDSSPVSWTPLTGDTSHWETVTSEATGYQALHNINLASSGDVSEGLSTALSPLWAGPYSLSLTFSRPLAGSSDGNISWTLNLKDPQTNGYSFRYRTSDHDSVYQASGGQDAKFVLTRLDEGSGTKLTDTLNPVGETDEANHIYRDDLIVDQGFLRWLHHDLTAASTWLVYAGDLSAMTHTGGYTQLELWQRDDRNEFRFEEVRLDVPPTTRALLCNETFEDLRFDDGSPIFWMPLTTGQWETAVSAATGDEALHNINLNSSGDVTEKIRGVLPGRFDEPTVHLTFSRPAAGTLDGNVSWLANLFDSNTNGVRIRYRTCAESEGDKFEFYRLDAGVGTQLTGFNGPGIALRDETNHLYREELDITDGVLRWIHRDLTAGTEVTVHDGALAGLSHSGGFTQVELWQRDDGNEFRFEELMLADQTGDSDGDQLPNGWERLYFGGVTNVLPMAAASNGLNSVLEAYIAGVSPVDPAARFGFSMAQQSGGLRLNWPSVSGRVYNVYWSSNLLSGFECIHSNRPWTANSFTSGVEFAKPSGFYRIEAELKE